MMKKIIILLVLCSFYSCQFDVENGVRVVVTGQVVDESGFPLRGIKVVRKVANRILGTAFTNTDGVFEMVSLESFQGSFSVYINDDEYGSYEGYSKVEVLDYDNPTERGVQLVDLGVISLQPTNRLQLIINNTSGTTDNFSFTVNYTQPSCVLAYQDNAIVQSASSCYTIFNINQMLPSNITTYERNIFNVQGDVFFSYQIGNAATESTVITTTNQDTTIYEISY